MKVVLPKVLLSVFFCSGIILSTWCQDTNPSSSNPLSFPDKLLSGFRKKAAALDERIKRQTEKYLYRLAKKEEKLKRKLLDTDSSLATTIFALNEPAFSSFAKSIKDSAFLLNPSAIYIPHLDSINGVMNFLGDNKFPGNINLSKATSALNEVKRLQTSFQNAESIKQYVRERRQQLKAVISQYSGLPPSVKRAFDNYRKEGIYYEAQIKEFKEILNDPDKLAAKAIELLSKLPVFQKFMAEHSILAALFRTPDNYGDPSVSLIGLQTRNQVSQLISNQLGDNSNAGQLFGQQLQNAQQELNLLKDRLTTLTSTEGDLEMPDFKPNQQKTKTFLQRIELGSNFQSQRASNYFPVTSDLALSVGYRIDNRSTAGIGLSYKLGWGKDIRNIQLSSQGAGLRSFIDIKIKGSFFLAGGLEYNYQKPFSSLDQVKYFENWSRCGLIGLSKIISIKTKLFKKTKVQVLWDFLSYQQRPQTQAFKFRIGYEWH